MAIGSADRVNEKRSVKTINVSQAEGLALGWLVAKADTNLYPVGDIRLLDGKLLSINAGDYEYSDRWRQYSPSTDWSQGGPIIEREGINLSVDYQDSALSNDMVQIGWKGNLWNNSVPGTAGFLQWAYGPTPLIAAMRCFVASKLGETVEVPEELCK